MNFEHLLFIASIFAGAVASISGFGIGSILTPLLTLQTTTMLAVSLVSIPHFIATFIRFWMTRKHIDKHVLWSFGLMSAAGGLVGAILHSKFSVPALTLIFGAILIFAGGMGASGLSEKLKFGRRGAWVAGGISGMLGGLVGNQGGIRSAAMLSFDVEKQAFIATATAVGLFVDGARLPVYLFSEWQEIAGHRQLLMWSVIGVVIGTFLGAWALRYIQEKMFKRMVSALILLLGIFMVVKGVQNG